MAKISIDCLNYVLCSVFSVTLTYLDVVGSLVTIATKKAETE